MAVHAKNPMVTYDLSGYTLRDDLDSIFLFEYQNGFAALHTIHCPSMPEHFRPGMNHRAFLVNETEVRERLVLDGVFDERRTGYCRRCLMRPREWVEVS